MTESSDPPPKREEPLSSFTADGGISLETGVEYEFTIPRSRGAERLEVEDAFFNTNSAVFLPAVPPPEERGEAQQVSFENSELWEIIRQQQASFYNAFYMTPFQPDRIEAKEMGLHALIAALTHLEENTDRKLMVAGHTDTSGQDATNMALSESRAKAVVALLEGDADAWAEAVAEHNNKKDDPIILRYVHNSRGWACDPGDETDQAPRSAVEGFQRGYNQAFGESIAEDGFVGPQTRKAYFDVFQGDLALLAGGDAAALDTLRGSLRWVDDANKIVACGELYPLDEPTKDDYVSASNRRVEILFFQPGEEPDTTQDLGEFLYASERYAFRPLHRHEFSRTSSGNQGDPADDVVLEDADEEVEREVWDGDADELVGEMPRERVRTDEDDPWAFLDAFDRAHPGQLNQAKPHDEEAGEETDVLNVAVIEEGDPMAGEELAIADGGAAAETAEDGTAALFASGAVKLRFLQRGPGAVAHKDLTESWEPTNGLERDDCERLGTIRRGTRLLRKGSQGNLVRSLQRLLSAAGTSVTDDGDFGDDTKTAVEAFQGEHELEVDGLVGRETMKALDKALDLGVSFDVEAGNTSPYVFELTVIKPERRPSTESSSADASAESDGENGPPPPPPDVEVDGQVCEPLDAQGIVDMSVRLPDMEPADRRAMKEHLGLLVVNDPALIDQALDLAGGDKKAVGLALLKGFTDGVSGMAKNHRNYVRLMKLMEAIHSGVSVKSLARFLRRFYYTDDQLQFAGLDMGDAGVNINSDLRSAVTGSRIRRWQEIWGPVKGGYVQKLDVAHSLVALDAGLNNEGIGGTFRAWVFTDFGDWASGIASDLGFSGAGDDNPVDLRGNDFGEQLYESQRDSSFSTMSRLLEHNFDSSRYLN